MAMDNLGALHAGYSRSSSRRPTESIRAPAMVPGEAVWAVGCATFVRNPQAMLPEPHDKPRPDPDDDLEDDPEDEPKDQPDDEVEDDPRDEPDAVLRARRLMHSSMLLKSNITPRLRGHGRGCCCGLSERLYIATPSF